MSSRLDEKRNIKKKNIYIYIYIYENSIEYAQLCLELFADLCCILKLFNIYIYICLETIYGKNNPQISKRLRHIYEST